MKVQDLMTKDVKSVRADDSLAIAAQGMWDHDCGAIPVRDPSDERVVGMITDRDICMATWSRGAAPDQIGVSEAMSKSLIYCSIQDSVESAEELLRVHRIRRMPVVDAERRLLGILSLADIARAASSGRFRELSQAQVSSTLGAICDSTPQLAKSA